MKRLILLFFIFSAVLLGQVTVSSPTSSFIQVKTLSGATMVDFVSDQQTGQGADDFIVNGLYLSYNTSATDPTLFYRAIFDKYESKGFSGNLRIGMDVNSDNAVDLFFGVSTVSSTRQIVFQLPTTLSSTTNTSPSNSSLGNIFNNITITANNYSYTQVDAVSNDASLTFSVQMSNINTALTSTGLTVNPSSLVHIIAFTSTNINTVNQDIYGTSGNTTSTTSYASLGAFTEYRDMNGNIIPEPSTYGAIMASLSLGTMFYIRRKRK